MVLLAFRLQALQALVAAIVLGMLTSLAGCGGAGGSTADAPQAAAATVSSVADDDAASAAAMRPLAPNPTLVLNSRARLGLEAVAADRRHAASVAEAEALFKKNDHEGAKTILKNVLLENPNNSAAILLQRQVNEAQAKLAAAGPSLQLKFKKPVTLQFRDANLKMIFESLSKTSGINILLD